MSGFFEDGTGKVVPASLTSRCQVVTSANARKMNLLLECLAS